MIMKNQLLNLKMIALMCLMMVLGGANVWAADKITDVANIVSGGKYYIGATTSNKVDCYLKINGSSISTGKQEEPTEKISEATIFVLEKSENGWVIKFDGTTNYLALNTGKKGKLDVKSTPSTFKFENLGGLIYMTSQNCALRRNKDYAQKRFGTYSTGTDNAMLDVWLMPATPAKVLTSLAISGQPTKKIYDLGEALNPAGLVVTGTYDDKSTATITDGITWAMNPATLSLNDVSCSVTATVDGVTSPAYNVTGLVVNKAKLPATITLTGNATTLGVDEPNTFTVDYDGDGTLSATASAEGVVDLALVGKTVTVTPKAAGSVDITISATEGTEYKAASTTYTVNVVPVGIAAIRNSITSISSNKKDAFAAKLKDAVVTYVGVKYNKKTFYVEDANAGVVFYNQDLNYEVGDVLNGTISGEGFIFQGLTEVTSINSNSNIKVTKGGKVPCTEITLAELNENMDKWESRRVKVVNSNLTTALDADNVAIISQDGNSITIFEKIDGCSGDKLANKGSKLESVVGYPVDFRQNKDSKILNELCIWEESDIVVATAEPTYTAQTLTFIAKDGADYYATFSSDKVTFITSNHVIPYVVTVANGKVDMKSDMFKSENTTIGSAEVDGYYIPAKTGILLYSDAENVDYYTVENYTVDDLAEDANMLMPSVAGGEFTAEASKVYYKLAYGDWTNKTQLGFYWGADNGGAFYVKAGTAYLAVPKAKAAGAKGFAFNGEATGIEGVNANVENAKAIYNLNGQRVASMAKPGLYIVNGKKVVRK